jgi:hypothetical protein
MQRIVIYETLQIGISSYPSKYTKLCRAIGHAVSHRLATRWPEFEPGVRSCGICGGQSDTGEGFLRVLRFSLPLMPPTAPHSSTSIIRGWYNTPSSARRTEWTQSHPKRRKRKNTVLQNEYAENAVFICFVYFYFLPTASFRILRIESQQPKTPWPQSASELYRPSDRSLSAKLVPTFADRGCHVVSVTDPLRPYSRFSRPEPLLFPPSSSSVVLTRLSGPRSRPTTCQKI